jgi:hypothetical protein
MKTEVVNQMMIIQIKRDIDEQIAQINVRLDALQKKINDLYESS